MITFFTEKCNTLNKNSLEFLESYEDRKNFVQSSMPSFEDLVDVSCPKCDAKNKLCFHGTYSRNISFLVNSKIENFNVSVNRVICKSCGSTHALLPMFIVPYKIMSAFSILEIIATSTKSSILKFSISCNISYQLIYSYIRLLLHFYTDLFLINNQCNTTVNFNEEYLLHNCLDYYNKDFLNIFFESTKWILLMNKFRNISPPLIFIKSNI